MDVDLDVLVLSDAGMSRTERLRVGGPMSVGRSAQCTLPLEGDLVSRTHAVIEPGPHGLRVEDRSSNGTLAGDLALHHQAATVPFGTPIVVGNYTLYVQPAGAPFPSFDDVDPLSAGTGAAPPPLPRPAPPPVAVVPPLRAPPAFGGQGVAAGPKAPPPPPTLPGQLPIGAALAATGTAHGHPGVPSSRRPLPKPPAPPGFPGRGAHDDARPPPAPPGIAPAGVPPNAAAPPGLSAAVAEALSREQEVALRREIHVKLLENLDLAKLDTSKMDDPSMRPRVLVALRRIVDSLGARIGPNVNRDALIGELADEALGLGPLEHYLADPTITEIMVVDPNTIFIERAGRLERTPARFTDDERVRAVIERIVTPLGRRIDESSPLVDARLRDGSRVNAVIRPLALRGSCITIRKFSKVPLTVDKLISFGTLTKQMARFLERSVVAKKNIVISGGTGSGKTTLLNVLSGAIPPDERIVTIEDSAELQLKQPHVVGMETRPANMEGRGEYTIRDLVKNALRMRPDRIVVGECRGGEALDMLQAMNTGHDGSLTTTHANSPAEALARLETLALMAGVDLPSRAIRDQIASAVHVIVQQARLADGSRRITEISEMGEIEDDGMMTMQPIFQFVRTGTGPGGKIIGEHRATGYLPSYLDELIVMGLVRPGEPFL